VSTPQPADVISAERWTLPAVPAAAGEARHLACAAAAQLGAAASVVEAIAVCVTEAVANAVVHAYRDLPEPGQVELEAAHAVGALFLYVRDAGTGMAPRLDSPGLGLGLPMMMQLADQLEVRRPPAGGTEILMRFGLAG
jgi:serine/threonine-protein kinase RsbW